MMFRSIRYRSGLIVLILLVGAVSISPDQLAGWDPATAHDKPSRDAFASGHMTKTASPPFAFVYGGKSSSGFIGKWTVTSDERTDGAKLIRTVAYTDPSTGLRVTAVYTIFRDHPAAEWAVRFKNTGRADTPIIEKVRACAVSFPGFAESASGRVTLYRARGSNAQRSDFGPIDESVAPKAEIRFGPTAGRSSDTNALPFFNIATPDRGVVAAIGWSGRWEAVVGRKGEGADPRALDLSAGMAETHFRLRPGEEVRTPSVALLFWKGPDRMSGHNLFRRFILAHHMPQQNGRPRPLPIAHGVGFGGPFPCNEYVCATESYAIGMIERLHQFGIAPDACWIDAGWYENPTGVWWSGVGTWTVNRKNFPRGLKPVTEAAKKLGQGFVVWFEPERAYEGTWLDREHKDWLTFLPGNRNRLLDLGNPEALAWLIDHISNFIRDEGVTIYRQDFNFDPAPYWRAMDAPDRVGIAEMKHIEGLYAFWDALLERHPGLLIDNCASGGRRIDLETTSRSIPLWRTDYQYYEPNGYQCHTYGLHFFVPASGTGNGDPRKYWFRSAAMGGAVVMGWELTGGFNLTAALEDMAEFRDVRGHFYGDYYPLTEYATTDDVWAAFQWNRPEEGDGIVMAFRRPQSPVSTIEVKLGGLDESADYEVTYDDYGITVVKNGRELAAGLTLKIPEAPASLLVKYRRVR
ncbi:MAG: alpha-galactosidase [Candidatus Aminicenantes bacterium]|nr:MAG: alpha-galactosidase [Candidatus Aminicenantes bacterium]